MKRSSERGSWGQISESLKLENFDNQSGGLCIIIHTMENYPKKFRMEKYMVKCDCKNLKY